MKNDLLLLPYEMSLLELNKFYKAEVVYNRLCSVVSWFDVSFEVFMNTVKQYQALEMGYEIANFNNIIYLKRTPIDKKKLNERHIRQNPQGETRAESPELSTKLFA